MTDISQKANTIFDALILHYHIADDIGQDYQPPYPFGSIEYLLAKKCWIDTLQWHVEDLIRAADIDPTLALQYKRRIDALNQERTNTVEQIDDYYLAVFAAVHSLPSATLNTESPAWAIDRLSILALKIYHMQQETLRNDITTEKKEACRQKLAILLEQREDLSLSIDQLLRAIAKGEKLMKVYRQMKMYNDPELNPVLYTKKT